jgi:thiamine-phosphate pyrophosphorylase
MTEPLPPWPRLIVITDLSAAPAQEWIERLTRLATLARGGSLAVLLRDHQLGARERLAFGRVLRALTRQRGQELWLADRLDLAILLEADGLHLGEASVTAESVAPFWSGRVSRAWHTPKIDATNEHELSGVGALLLSPILSPRKGRAPLGVAALGGLGEPLRARNSAYPLMIYALGGVTAATAPECLAAGAQGIAVIGAALSDDAAALVSRLGIAQSSG